MLEELNKEIDRNDNPNGIRCLNRDGFIFTCSYNNMIYDTLIVRHPKNAPFMGSLLESKKTLVEHIDLINKHKLEKVLIISNSIEFIKSCPSLKYIQISPSVPRDEFDYSPLYEMPEIKSLNCRMSYGENQTIDYSKINGLEDIHITNNYQINFENIGTLKSLAITDYLEKDISKLYTSKKLDTLLIFTSKIKNIKGIDNSSSMQCLYLINNRSLEDISELEKVNKTLRALTIENSSKLTNFEVLSKLTNIEYLKITGSNKIPNMEFIKELKNLKTLILEIEIENGDLTPCLGLSYVYVKGKKHYNLKDKDLPKGKYIKGNENIEEWRRINNL